MIHVDQPHPNLLCASYLDFNACRLASPMQTLKRRSKSKPSLSETMTLSLHLRVSCNDIRLKKAGDKAVHDLVWNGKGTTFSCVDPNNASAWLSRSHA